MKVLDHEVLLQLNQSSIEAGRGQHLRPEQIPVPPGTRYWINTQIPREREGHPEVRLCIVLDLFSGRTVWLDISPGELAAIPDVGLSEDEWEAAMCAGTPPKAT